jgi:hypothetical protein
MQYSISFHELQYLLVTSVLVFFAFSDSVKAFVIAKSQLTDISNISPADDFASRGFYVAQRAKKTKTEISSSLMEWERLPFL